MKDIFWTTNDKISKKKKKRNSEDKGSFYLRVPLTNRTPYLSFFYTLYILLEPSFNPFLRRWRNDSSSEKRAQQKYIKCKVYPLFPTKKRKGRKKRKKKKFFNVLRNVYESTRVAQRVFFVSQRYFDKYRRTQKTFDVRSFVRSATLTPFEFCLQYLLFIPFISVLFL